MRKGPFIAGEGHFSLLVRYLEENYAGDSDVDKAAFREVLTLSDPELNSYLLQRQTPESESIARIIDRILRRNTA